MGRPPKSPEDRHATSIRIPLTEAERELIKQAAQVDDAKYITWARNVLLKAAKRRVQ